MIFMVDTGNHVSVITAETSDKALESLKEIFPALLHRGYTIKPVQYAQYETKIFDSKDSVEYKQLVQKLSDVNDENITLRAQVSTIQFQLEKIRNIVNAGPDLFVTANQS
jgi:hypothetical protein